MAALMWSYTVACIKQIWHCRRTGHRPLTKAFFNRVYFVGCSDCNAIFWERAIMKDENEGHRPSDAETDAFVADIYNRRRGR